MFYYLIVADVNATMMLMTHLDMTHFGIDDQLRHDELSY